jgi:AmmeMemoRadiSam system protein B
MDGDSTRAASHAGSWYSDKKSELDKQLTSWLDNAKLDVKNVKLVKAVIGPHAGFAYSGPTAAWAYKYFKAAPKDPLRVFLLGPCHHVYMKGCGLSSLKTYQTPLGNIDLDTETIAKLKKEGNFEFTDKDVEEDEHSLEMHLPYIKKMFDGRAFKLVPIMVGNTDPKMEAYYGKLLSSYFDDDNTVFIVSSDFCHWGKRFSYTYYNKEDGEIHKSIEKLDTAGMNLIEENNISGFTKYLEDTQNTICGRHPIGVLLNVIQNSKSSSQLKSKFVKYAQSEPVKDKSQSSVSYAAAIVYLE